MKSVDYTTENGKKHYSTIDKDIKIQEESGNNLQESWKLDLSDGSKIRANTLYNMNGGKSEIHLTYENNNYSGTNHNSRRQDSGVTQYDPNLDPHGSRSLDGRRLYRFPSGNETCAV